MIKEKFKERAIKLLGKDASEYFKILKEPLLDSLRVNTLKINVNALVERLKEKGWELKQVPFVKEGYWVLKGPKNIGNCVEHFLGYFYSQEPASMIPPIVLNPKPNELILDMAASPGSKTSQIAALMNNKGLIFANDVRIDRVKILKINLQRMGVSSVIITRKDGRNYKKNPEMFDKVLLDAPCSAEGAIRKKWSIINKWNLGVINKLSRIQKDLIAAAFTALKPGGALVYSTCTLAPEENERVVNYLLEKFENAKAVPFKIKGLKTRPGIAEWHNEKYDKSIKSCARVYPQDNDTEGFFIAKVVKKA